MAYIDFPVVTDPNAISAAALDYLTANLANWLPDEAHLEVRVIEALAQMVAEASDTASRVPKSIFRYFGETVMVIPPIDGAPAEVDSTWTAIDGQGYTIRAGTVVGFRTAGDVLLPFTVSADVVIPPGYNQTAAGGVHLVAVDEGTTANGIAAGTAIELVDALSWVAAIVSTDATAGGADAETDDEYLNRLTSELTLMSPRLILPADFAVYAKRTPGVYRATAIDGYNPNTATYNNERTVTVAVVDANGNALPGATKTLVQNDLEAQREVNFQVFIIDPTTTAIPVDFTATASPGYTLQDVHDRAVAAVTAYLQPYNWNGGDQIPPQWYGDNVVRYLEIATLLNNVLGIKYVTALTIHGAAADYALPGVAPLTTPGAITGTVTA